MDPIINRIQEVEENKKIHVSRKELKEMSPGRRNGYITHIWENDNYSISSGSAKNEAEWLEKYFD